MLDTSKTRGSCSCELKLIFELLIDFLFSFFGCHFCLLVSNRIIWWETPR